jgi:carbon-monoxide dehydrogenase medium subunit
VAAALDLSGGVIRSARVGVTGAGPYATRLTQVEAALAGKPPERTTIEEASRLADGGLDDVNSDLHASAEYRRAMVRVFTKRALTGAVARATAP